MTDIVTFAEACKQKLIMDYARGKRYETEHIVFDPDKNGQLVTVSMARAIPGVIAAQGRNAQRRAHVVAAKLLMESTDNDCFGVFSEAWMLQISAPPENATAEEKAEFERLATEYGHISKHKDRIEAAILHVSHKNGETISRMWKIVNDFRGVPHLGDVLQDFHVRPGVESEKGVSTFWNRVWDRSHNPSELVAKFVAAARTKK